MSADKFFLDTDILVYSFAPEEPGKAVIARKLITRGLTSGLGVISYQVAREFANLALKQFAHAITPAELERYFLRVLFPLMKISCSPPLFLQALQLQTTNRLSWYDSLIIAAAMQGACKVVYSEDFQHGQRFGDLLVQNPFQ